jgi:UDP-N-acetylglucosamine--N-acetylmuramyl-(pentapeptide) pyrophosphoryl-undecaprenol N-acetylglucosamine transferase
MKMKKIILTGGGTAGHVTPNLALIPELKKRGYEIYYIGSKNGIEKNLVKEAGIPYYGISSGKLRRYMDIKNFTDPFRIIKGFHEARKIIKEIKPDIVFSKGGFVTVPVVMAAKGKKIPIVIHESDISSGLANRLCLPYATKICVNFPETLENLPPEKAVMTGSPIRRELFQGNRIKGLDFCGFTANMPVILVIGGSLGSSFINDTIRRILPELLKEFQVIHLCGKEKTDKSLNNKVGYVQFEYIQKELCNLLNMADLVVSRAGANAICELVTLGKPNILIPLSKKASRGDQICNAESFEKQGFSFVIQEDELTEQKLLDAIKKVYEERNIYKEKMSADSQQEAVTKVSDVIDSACKETEMA